MNEVVTSFDQLLKDMLDLLKNCADHERFLELREGLFKELKERLNHPKTTYDPIENLLVTYYETKNE